MADIKIKISGKLSQWLIHEHPPPEIPLCDFNRLREELQLGDILLVEGRTRIANVIRIITQSPWTHAALYIGPVSQISDPLIHNSVLQHWPGDVREPLILEAVLGKGTVVTALSEYAHDHLRICRPDGISQQDALKVAAYCVNRLGTGYDLRQILDLARFLFPWSILPRRWRSSLFQHNAGDATRTVCSTLLAEAFSSVDFPILPFINRDDDGSLHLFKRNPKLFAPRDFDYSPYFSIIKYPFIGVNDVGLYRRLPWERQSGFYNDQPHTVPAQHTDSPLLSDSDLGRKEA